MMVRQVPRYLVLPLLLCVVAAASLAVVGQVVALQVSSLIDARNVRISLPGPPEPTNTVWLCKPGMAANPCAGDLDATVVASNGTSSVEPAAAAAHPPVDCFYVYPTVSLQKTVNATLRIDPEEKNVARAEASRFSQVCNVYAPMYPQLTKAAIDDPGHVSATGFIDAYEGVWKAFLDYKDHYNHGRGIVFIGHSQGAFLLSMLLQAEVDTEPAVLDRLVSALLPGGNVTVQDGKTTGGDFHNIPACGSDADIACVVAYSSFTSAPGEDSLFGRVSSPLNPFHQDAPTKLRVLCVNPAAPGGGSGELTPYLPTGNLDSLLGTGKWPALSAGTPFVSYRDALSARCETKGDATWLQIDKSSAGAAARLRLADVESPRWGLHMVDMSLAMGNLVNLVRSESAAYARKH